MARSKRAAANSNAGKPASPGHNSKPGLTDEEAAALTTHYALKIIEDQRKVAAKKVEMDGLREVVNGHFKRLTADLHFTRKEFEAEVIAKLNMTDAEFASSERKRDRLHRLAGLKQGEQIDLIDHVLPDTVDDAMNAESDGYRAGRRADDPELPSQISSMFASDWMRGYHAGQEFNALQLGKAAEILARPKPGTMAPAEPQEEEADPLDPDVIGDEARALKKSGWLEPTAEEQSFAAE